LSTTRIVKTELGEITYELSIKRVKNINIRVHPDGSVHVSAARHMGVHAADEAVRGRAAWIAAHRAELTASKPWMFAGEPVQLTERAGTTFYCHLDNGNLLLTAPPNATAEQKNAVIHSFYASALRAKLPQLQALAAELGVPVRLRVKDMRSRWGSYSYKTARVSLHARLAAFPENLLIYVFMHELAHAKAPGQGHGPGFHKALAALLPDYAMRRRELRRLGQATRWEL